MYQIQVPGLINDFLVLSRPWSLIGNLVANRRLRRFDSRWPQTLTLAVRCTERSPDAALRDGYVKLIKYERAKEEASTLVNAQASQDVAYSSSIDLARPPANVAPKPKSKPSPRLGRGKPKPGAMGSMVPINNHFSPLPELPPLPDPELTPGFILPPDVFALFSQGPVQDENSAKRPRLM